MSRWQEGIEDYFGVVTAHVTNMEHHLLAQEANPMYDTDPARGCSAPCRLATCTAARSQVHCRPLSCPLCVCRADSEFALRAIDRILEPIVLSLPNHRKVFWNNEPPGAFDAYLALYLKADAVKRRLMRRLRHGVDAPQEPLDQVRARMLLVPATRFLRVALVLTVAFVLRPDGRCVVSPAYVCACRWCCPCVVQRLSGCTTAPESGWRCASVAVRLLLVCRSLQIRARWLHRLCPRGGGCRRCHRGRWPRRIRWLFSGCSDTR